MDARLQVALRKGLDGFSVALVNVSPDTIDIGGWRLGYPGVGWVGFPDGMQLRRAAPNSVEVLARDGDDTSTRVYAGRELLGLLLGAKGVLYLRDRAGVDVCRAEGLLACYEEEVRREVDRCCSPDWPTREATSAPA